MMLLVYVEQRSRVIACSFDYFYFMNLVITREILLVTSR